MANGYELVLVGIGPGHLDHLTLAAIEALNGVDLILLPRKGEDKADLVRLRRAICDRVLRRPVRCVEFDLPVRAGRNDYEAAVAEWHDAIAAVWWQQLATHLPAGGRVALLIWGDPTLYDSSLRIAARVRQRCGGALQVTVVPGITSVHALVAAHGIALNEVAEPVLITTGRRLRERGWPRDADTVVVMLDGGCAFQTLDPAGLSIWWGAYLGLPQQTLISGALATVADEIVRQRAALRQRHGWIMDIYLLRRIPSSSD